MTDSFYRAYEDRHRGSRELIKSRLRAYAPFVEPLSSLYPSATAIDLGCGRGEWIELMSESGFDATGIDIDDGMLAACRELGLKVRQEDALKALQDLPDDSAALVSAFHVAEHLPFEVLRSVVREALRVLKPGGLLILETPNPENLVVGASSFYQDPTHARPIPPELLRFVVEYAGFARNRIVRLQEEQSLHADAGVRLIQVLSGVSPDYGVVAQKQAGVDILSCFDGPFKAQYGITLDALAQRHDADVEQRLAGLHRLLSETEARLAGTGEHMAARIAALEERIGQLASRAAHADAWSAQLEERVSQAESKATQAENLAVQGEARAAQLVQQLHAMQNSRSWRITAPMRYAGCLFYRFRSAVKERRLVSGMKRRINSLLYTTRLGRSALSILNRNPRLKAHLRRMMSTAPAVSVPAPPEPKSAADLSPRAARLYAELKRIKDTRKN